MFENSFLHSSGNHKNCIWWSHATRCGWRCFIFHSHPFKFSFSSCVRPDHQKFYVNLRISLNCYLFVTYLAGLKFSFSESDSKFPNTFACLDFNDSLCSWRSSESLNVGLTPPSMLLYASPGLSSLSSVGCGAQAKNLNIFFLIKIRLRYTLEIGNGLRH